FLQEVQYALEDFNLLVNLTNTLATGNLETAVQQIQQLLIKITNDVLLKWPTCWAAEAQRVVIAMIGLIQTQMMILSALLNW
ncbi:hypothetical protein PMAYCL1PPCAC_15805, partial [Pristionchus mayeri]